MVGILVQDIVKRYIFYDRHYFIIIINKVLFHNLTCLQVCLQEEEESEHFTLRRLEVEANSIL